MLSSLDLEAKNVESENAKGIQQNDNQREESTVVTSISPIYDVPNNLQIIRF